MKPIDSPYPRNPDLKPPPPKKDGGDFISVIDFFGAIFVFLHSVACFGFSILGCAYFVLGNPDFGGLSPFAMLGLLHGVFLVALFLRPSDKRTQLKLWTTRGLLLLWIVLLYRSIGVDGQMLLLGAFSILLYYQAHRQVVLEIRRREGSHFPVLSDDTEAQ